MSDTVKVANRLTEDKVVVIQLDKYDAERLQSVLFDAGCLWDVQEGIQKTLEEING